MPSGKKKKTGEELAREVLAHFEMTVRSFYSSLAKAIHQHPRRRGDESLPVSGPMRSVALYLGLVMKSSFEKLTQNDQASTLQARSTPRIRSLCPAPQQRPDWLNDGGLTVGGREYSQIKGDMLVYFSYVLPSHLTSS